MEETVIQRSHNENAWSWSLFSLVFSLNYFRSNTFISFKIENERL